MMKDSAEEKDRVRAMRQSAYDTANLLHSLEIKDGTGEKLNWDDLTSVPDWCFWPEDKRVALASTAGALFLAPAMRLWIDAERIRSARQVLGESLYEAVLQYEATPQLAEQPPQNMPVERLLVSTGVSVLLGSLEAPLQTLMKPLLPDSEGQVQQAIARQIADEAQSLLLRLTAEFIAARDAESAAQ